MSKAHICSVVLSIWSSVAVLLAAGIGASGCTGIRDGGVCMAAHPSGKPACSLRFDSPPRGGGDSGSWKEGIIAFERGDYKDAQAAFQRIVKSSADEGLRLNGLYAFACTRFLLARNSEELAAAMNLLELWSDLSPVGPYDRDSHMTASLLRRILVSHTEGQGAGLRAHLTGHRPAGAPPSAGSVAPDREKNKQKEIIKVVKEKDQECEGLLRRREKENQALKHQIWVLRHQIEALEAIHREIQEKKEQVSPP